MSDEIPALTAISALEQFKLDVLTLTLNNVTAAKEALTYIGTSQLKFTLFKTAFAALTASGDPISRAMQAVTNAKSLESELFGD